MTTTVVIQLAALLGDDVDHSRYIWREGRAVAPHRQRGWCCWLEYGEGKDARHGG